LTHDLLKESELLSMLLPADQATVTSFTRTFGGRLVELRTPDGTRFRGESTPVRFLRSLFHPGDGYVNFRAISRDKKISSLFIPTNEPERVHDFLKEHRDANIYFGVASRRSDRNGRLENCGTIRALWADIDFKDTPEPEAREAVERFALEPSVIVATGNGLHVYWLLDEPYDVQSDAERLKNILRRLATTLKADFNATDPARVLRLPGTLNIKYEPAREVILERLT
jgi:hypothetical protein